MIERENLENASLINNAVETHAIIMSYCASVSYILPLFRRGKLYAARQKRAVKLLRRPASVRACPRFAWLNVHFSWPLVILHFMPLFGAGWAV